MGRVAAGAIAQQVLATLGPVEIVAWVDRIETLQAQVDAQTVTREMVDKNDVRCPDERAAKQMRARIVEVRSQGDSIGGVVRVVARGIPAGLGEPVFEKLDAVLAQGLMSLPACKGVEVGSGFRGTEMTGRAHNDPFVSDEHGNIRTQSNHSGGIQGGISNGMPIVLSAAFKPVATVFHDQQTGSTRCVRAASRCTHGGIHGVDDSTGSLASLARPSRLSQLLLLFAAHNRAHIAGQYRLAKSNLSRSNFHALVIVDKLHGRLKCELTRRCQNQFFIGTR